MSPDLTINAICYFSALRENRLSLIQEVCACFRGSGVSGQPISSGLIWSERTSRKRDLSVITLPHRLGESRGCPDSAKKKRHALCLGSILLPSTFRVSLSKLWTLCLIHLRLYRRSQCNSFPHHLLKFTCQVSSNLTFINSSQCCSSVHPFADTIWSSCWSTYKICCRTHVLSRGICYATV